MERMWLIVSDSMACSNYATRLLFTRLTMSLTQVFIFFFCCGVASIYITQFIRNMHNKKQLLLMPIEVKKTVVPLNPLLENRYIGIALSNALDQTFAKVHDEDTRMDLIETLRSCSNFPDDKTISLLDLSRVLSKASKEQSGTDVSFWLDEVSTASIEHLGTMVDDVESTHIKSKELSRLMEFCLHNVELAGIEYA